MQLVRDVDGDTLKSDAKYFVVAATPEAGGGVTRTSDTVVQSLSNVDKGTSVYFKPMAPTQAEIPESADLNIEFSLDDNNVWMVESSMFLSTNGHPLNASSRFQIKKVNDLVYKLVFCPSGEHFRDIGIKDVAERRLAIKTDNTFNVVFKKDP